MPEGGMHTAVAGVVDCPAHPGVLLMNQVPIIVDPYGSGSGAGQITRLYLVKGRALFAQLSSDAHSPYVSVYQRGL